MTQGSFTNGSGNPFGSLGRKESLAAICASFPRVASPYEHTDGQ